MISEADQNLLRDHIQDELVIIEETIAHLADAVRAVSPDNALGRLTRMDAIGDQSVAKAKLSQLQERRGNLQKALRSLNSPTFGVCGRCKQPISMDRLLALPEAQVCMRCMKTA